MCWQTDIASRYPLCHPEGLPSTIKADSGLDAGESGYFLPPSLVAPWTAIPSKSGLPPPPPACLPAWLLQLTPLLIFCPPPQSKLHMEGFRSLKEGEAVEFTFKKSSKGLESIRVTGPGGVFCIGSERRPKGKNLQKRRSKGDR